MDLWDITNLPADELRSFMITMLDKIAKSGLTLNIGCGNTTHNYSNSNNTNTDNSVSNSYCNSHNTNKSTSYENIGNTSNTNTYTNSFNTNTMLTPGNNDVWEIIGDMCRNKTTYENIDGDVYKINPNKKTIKHIQSEVNGNTPSKNTNLGETVKSLLFDSLTVGTALGTSYLSRRK